MNCSRRWIGVTAIAVLSAVLPTTSIFVSPLHGQDAPASQPAGDRPRGRGPSLGGDMRNMAQAFGKIRAQYKDPTKNESTLAYLSAFEAQVAAAKALLPPTITSITDEDAKQKAAEEYHGMLRSLIRAALDLEDEITAGDMDKAAATITTMQGIEQSGHSEFRH
jgi:cytochrome b562